MVFGSRSNGCKELSEQLVLLIGIYVHANCLFQPPRSRRALLVRTMARDISTLHCVHKMTGMCAVKSAVEMMVRPPHYLFHRDNNAGRHSEGSHDRRTNDGRYRLLSQAGSRLSAERVCRCPSDVGRQRKLPDKPARIQASRSGRWHEPWKLSLCSSASVWRCVRVMAWKKHSISAFDISYVLLEKANSGFWHRCSKGKLVKAYFPAKSCFTMLHIRVGPLENSVCYLVVAVSDAGNNGPCRRTLGKEARRTD